MLASDFGKVMLPSHPLDCIVLEMVVFVEAISNVLSRGLPSLDFGDGVRIGGHHEMDQGPFNLSW